MVNKLREEDREWIENAHSRGFTKLQMRRKLEESKFSDERMDLFLEYFSELGIPEVPKLENEEKFEKDVKKYFTDEKSGMSWGERRAVKKYLKQIEKYSKLLREVIKGIKEATATINKKFNDKEKIKKEMDAIKEELVDRIMDSKTLFDIVDPETGLEETKESLMNKEIEYLEELMLENINELENTVNGRF